MDLQLAHDIISICNEDSGGATVEDCAEQLGKIGRASCRERVFRAV